MDNSQFSIIIGLVGVIVGMIVMSLFKGQGLPPVYDYPYFPHRPFPTSRNNSGNFLIGLVAIAVIVLFIYVWVKYSSNGQNDRQSSAKNVPEQQEYLLQKTSEVKNKLEQQANGN